MGYDNECIVNMQSLPGEYFCPVCRTLINPDEALQAPCTHLFCKPCLAYVVATTHACAYDGYLVTEADSKSLGESNKELAETIGKIAVYCLYHRSNCQWQGTLAESTAHCAGCTFGNSPVVCNRCGTQIIHRQVQEHAQICPGVQPQAQAAENVQAQAAAGANQVASQDPSSAASAGSLAAAAAAPSVAATMATPLAPASAPAAATVVTGQAQVQGAAAVYPQAALAPTPEQLYQQQQQYQQHYQQYPGYDPYQQQYYAQYQQQAYPQYMQAQIQHMAPQPYMQQPQSQPQSGQPHAQGQSQAQPLPQSQPQPQPQPPPQPQPQPQGLAAQPQLHQLPQPQPHTQPQPQPHVSAQVPQIPVQQPLATPQQPHPHAPYSHPPPYGNAAGQPYPQPQPQVHAAQARPPQLQAPLQYQQPVPPQQIPQQMPQPHAYHQHQPRAQHAPQPHPLPHPQQPPMQMQPQPQPHPHPHPHSHPQANPQLQHPQPPAHPIAGYQSYPQPTPGAPQQHPMHMNPPQQGMPSQLPQSQSHFPPHQPPQMHPPHSQMTMPVQQQPAMPPLQGGPANLYPTQQQVQQPAQQPGPPVYQQPGMQPHMQHGFVQPQAQGPLHPGQPSQQGPAPLQHSLRPQGLTYMQQPTPGHPHVQMNAPPGQGMPSHQAHARPMMVSQGMPQQPVPQSPIAGSKPIQSGPMQQLQLLHAGSQGASSATPKQGASTPDKIGKVPPLEDGLAVKNAEGSKAGENVSEHVFDSKSKGDEGKCAMGEKEKDILAEENKDVSETLAKEENVDGPLVKQVKAEEANTSDEVTEGSHGLKVAGGEKEVKGQEGTFSDKSSSLFKGGHTRPIPELHTQQGSVESVQREPLQPNSERTNQDYVSDGQISGNVNNVHHSHQMQTQGALDRGQLQRQSAHQSVFPTQGHGYPQPGYSDRNPTQFPQQYPGSDECPGMPPCVQQIPYGHPHQMPDPTMTSQRPPAPDRMFPQPMHQSSQERRFPELSSHQMHVHGQAMPPSQMRPPGHNVHESFPHQGQLPAAQESFWPPPYSGIPGPGLPPPPGGVPSYHGFPPNGFEQQAMAPPGQTQNHPPPSHVGGARTALGEPLARTIMRGPSPGVLDTPNRMAGGPPFIPDDRMGNSANVNAMEAEADVIKRHGVFDGRQLEPHRPLPTEHAPYGQPNVMKMNGMANHVTVGGMHESSFSHGLPGDRFRPLPEERFKPFPEEGFKSAHDEHFRASALDPGRHIPNKRDFEEDLKQFPRPGHLDSEGPSRIDGYFSSSRALEKMTQHPGGSNALTSRPPSSYQPGVPLPPNFGGSQVRLDKGDRDRPLPLHDQSGRRHDGTFAHPDRLNLVPGFGRHQADGLPPVRSPGHFSRDIPDGLPNQNMPGFSMGGSFGGFCSHLDSGETGGPGNLASHLRIGDPGFNGRFSSASREGDIDNFEQSRKRKAGSMSRCLICKIDCDTIEGLDLHSQTREHQKMAMDMVLNIKKENAKKHRTSENATPFEHTNKLRKASFGKRANANRK